MGKGGSLWIIAVVVILTALFAVTASATVSEMYFSADRNGQVRVTNIHEGDEVWICVYDPDENIDADQRDKMFTDISVLDPNTNAQLDWQNTGNTSGNYLEETTVSSGLFVSKQGFMIGRRANVTNGDWTHTSGALNGGADVYANGSYMHLGVTGRVENMDTLFGMYKDPNDYTDIAVTMMKIIDTESTISWDQEVYLDLYSAATITIMDPDENLDVNRVEYVPVFVIVNPGSWNPVREGSAANFCMLKRYGGVDPATGNVLNQPIRWYNIYDSGLGAPYPQNNQPTSDCAYYIQYPTAGSGNVTSFDTIDPHGYCRVMFYARETGINTGVFQLHLTNILNGLGFNSLSIRDVLVAYYIDPNDKDDFALSTAYIEAHQHSMTSFTDAVRSSMSEYWLGRDAVHVQVIDPNANVDSSAPEQIVVHICDPHGEDDAEWIILDETSSNSPVFFNNTGTQLRPVWDSSGLQVFPGPGGYQLQLDNWRFEAYNEDAIYARYNDVYYTSATMSELGDADTSTAFPPEIDRIRVGNDLSFAAVKIADTQVYDGQHCNMYFLDRQGNRVAGYGLSDCVFIEVIDPDQNEDPLHRERIDAYWDGRQDLAYAMQTSDIFGNPPRAKIYIVNPRNGNWGAVDLQETGIGTGDFVSVSCINLTSVYTSVPTLGVLTGDTILAFYQDPSNHSDFAVISIKVGPGGGTLPPSQASTTMFTDADGNEVYSYTDADNVYVKVIDASHTGATNLADAVEMRGNTYDLFPLAGASNDTFITHAISMSDLGVGAGNTITATYTDPTDPTDTSSDTISITNLYISCWFSYELTSVDSAANTFTLTLKAHTYPDTVTIDDWHWSFGDGTEDHGETVTHTFSGLGEVCAVTLDVIAGAANGTYTEVVWGLGGLAWDLSEALQSGDASTLQQLQGVLSWSGGSVEKICRTCVDAALKVFELADRYGLTSLNQVSQALSKALEGPPSLSKSRRSLLPRFDTLTKPLKAMVKPPQGLLSQLPGWQRILGTVPPKTGASTQRQMVGSITLPQIYQEAEDIATFVNDELTHLSPVVSDTTFELQVPTCVGCDPTLYVSLDNGDIAGILAGIAGASAALETLLAYTPGDLFMSNLAFQYFDQWPGPTASFTATPSAGQSPLTVSFDASASTAQYGSVVSYSWDFGDATTGSGQVVSHTYTLSPGEDQAIYYTVLLWVTDSNGYQDTAVTSITVTRDAPASAASAVSHVDHSAQLLNALGLVSSGAVGKWMLPYVTVDGWDTITGALWDSFDAARGNGVLDLNGSGDGDAALGCEVLPASCLTLRDGQWLQSAKANLVQALAWLREAIQDMPTSPGLHDPQIEWPLEMYWPWTGENTSISKADLLSLIDTVEACLQRPTTVDIDINFDGVTDYSTEIDLSSFFDDPITDLKALLPELVVTSNPDDPLILLRSNMEGIDHDWKTDGTLNWSTEHVSINFPDPTFGGILPHGDADDLLALLLFGHANPTCQNQSAVLEASGWHMLTLPGELCSSCEPWGPGEGGDLICALSDDLDPCYIFHYDPEAGGYAMAPPAENIQYHAGMGFWVRTYEDNVTIDAEVQVATEAVEVPLGNGWNQIGNPFAFGVAADALKVRCGDTELSLTDAQAQGWVSAYLFGYDTASGGYVMIDPTTGCLQPWNGYWMRSYLDDCVLIIPPTECSGSAPAGEPLSTKELRARGLELPPQPPALKLMSEDVVKGLTVYNIPNPIRSQHTTTFKVEGKGAELVQAIRVEIYDQAGQKVFTEDINAKELDWHTNNDTGELLANGVYLYQVWVKIAGAWYATGVHKLAVVR